MIFHDILEKKNWLTQKYYKSKLAFANDTKVYVIENSTPYNQHLAWKCRELTRAKVWSMKGVIKIIQLPNEQAYSINNKDDIKYLFPGFILKENYTLK